MQYGVFSDIHGNLASLEAVWRTLTEAGLTDRTVLNAGDNVGYGASPEACVQFLRAHSNIVTVRGNYDKNVAEFPEREAEYQKKWRKSRPEKYEALRRDSAAISDDTRRWLLDLPREVTLTLDGVPVLLTHYAPGRKEGLGRWTPDSRLYGNWLRRDIGQSRHLRPHAHTRLSDPSAVFCGLTPAAPGRGWGSHVSYADL